MTIHIIPSDKLSTEALKGVIDEFISRDGTDYGAMEASPETKFKQVKQKTGKRLGRSYLYDEAETTNIFMKDDPLLEED